MKVQSNQLPSIPSWVVMDQDIHRKNLGDDGEASAEVRATNGEPVRVSFSPLCALPGTSRFCVHYPEERELSSFDTVVATHRNAVLFRLEVDFEELPPTHYAKDYFIYWAYPSSPELSLLPRCYWTQEEIAAEVGFWRTHQRMVDRAGIGLLITGDKQFVVAELYAGLAESKDGDDDAPLEADLFRLRSTAGKWEVKRPKVREGKATFRDVLWWDTYKVVPFANYLCWVDYFRGVIFCDVYHDDPELQYLPLPVDDVPLGNPDHCGKGWPQASRTVCVTKGETMKFVNVVRSNGYLSGRSKPGSGFTIIIWTLRPDYGDMEWVKDVVIEADELWAMEGYDDQLPRIAPEFPLVSMDNPHIIYFVLRERHTLDADAKTWIVTLDMKSKSVLSYKDVKAIPSEEDAGMASRNIFRNMSFFPSEFCRYLKKPATSLNEDCSKSTSKHVRNSQ